MCCTFKNTGQGVPSWAQQARPWVHVCQAGTVSRHAHASSGTPLLSFLKRRERTFQLERARHGTVIFLDLPRDLQMYTHNSGFEISRPDARCTTKTGTFQTSAFVLVLPEVQPCPSRCLSIAVNLQNGASPTDRSCHDLTHLLQLHVQGMDHWHSSS